MEHEVGLRQIFQNEVKSFRNIALIVSFTGLVFLSTSIFFIAIPTSNGFFNIGEIFVYLAALIGGPITGAIAGGVGASLADVALGYGVFAPGTLFIKGIEGFLVGLIFHFSRRLKRWIRYLFMFILCGVLIGFSAFYVNEEFLFGMAFYGSKEFTVTVPGYVFLIIALVLSLAILLVLIFLKERGEMALSCIAGGSVIVLGYFFYETVVLKYALGAAASEIPFNIAQVVLSAAIAIPIVSYLNQLGVLKRYEKETQEAEEDLLEG
jgi:uncharacterized membrane protein